MNYKFGDKYVAVKDVPLLDFISSLETVNEKGEPVWWWGSGVQGVARYFVAGNVSKQQLSMKCLYMICSPFVMEMT